MSAPYVLVVDDEPDIRELVSEILADEAYQVGVAENGAKARQALRDRRPDLILLDIWMPDVDGISLLQEWSEAGELPCPVIMMSGHGTVETAVEATRLGAYDFLEKPLSLAKLLLTAERALEAQRLLQENVGLRRRSATLFEPVGSSRAMQRLREQVKRVAQHDSWVLISGEPGSGRETYARYLHAHSSRSARPFVDVGVSAITQGGAALELFGREQEGHIQYGRLEQASGGTLFLDDIDDMPLPTQVKLLRALQEREFERVGGETAVRVDIRVVVATKVDLRELVAEGRFRDDLYWRIHVVPVLLPALRERAGDVPLLVQHLLERHGGGRAHTVPRSTMALLERYPWPGNVRELENAVQRAIALCGSDGVLASDDLLPADPRWRGAAQVPQAIRPLRDVLREHEREHLAHALEWTGGHRQQTAELLGISRKVLWEKLKDHGLGREEEA